MNTLNINLRNQTSGLNRQTFRASANVKLPDWVGKFSE